MFRKRHIREIELMQVDNECCFYMLSKWINKKTVSVEMSFLAISYHTGERGQGSACRRSFLILSNFFFIFNALQDGGSPSLSSSASLLIMVKDVQDTPPIFQRLPYMTTIREDTHVVMVQLISILKLFDN